MDYQPDELRAMRAHESRVRRLAHRHGYSLVKSRNRTPETYVFGTYGLIDPLRNTWVTHDPVGQGYGWSLTQVADYLKN